MKKLLAAVILAATASAGLYAASLPTATKELRGRYSWDEITSMSGTYSVQSETNRLEEFNAIAGTGRAEEVRRYDEWKQFNDSAHPIYDDNVMTWTWNGTTGYSPDTYSFWRIYWDTTTNPWGVLSSHADTDIPALEPAAPSTNRLELTWFSPGAQTPGPVAYFQELAPGANCAGYGTNEVLHSREAKSDLWVRLSGTGAQTNQIYAVKCHVHLYKHSLCYGCQNEGQGSELVTYLHRDTYDTWQRWRVLDDYSKAGTMMAKIAHFFTSHTYNMEDYLQDQGILGAVDRSKLYFVYVNGMALDSDDGVVYLLVRGGSAEKVVIDLADNDSSFDNQTTPRSLEYTFEIDSVNPVTELPLEYDWEHGVIFWQTPPAAANNPVETTQVYSSGPVTSDSYGLFNGGIYAGGANSAGIVGGGDGILRIITPDGHNVRALQLGSDSTSPALWVDGSGMAAKNRDGTSLVGFTAYWLSSAHLTLPGVWASYASGGSTTLSTSDTHSIQLVTSSGATITLPSATVASGRTYRIKAVSPATGVTVATTGSQTIDGATTYSLSANKFVEVISDGSKWLIIGQN